MSTGGKTAAFTATAAAFTLTIFVSASLLFFVQPMYAKMVLPNLGGAPAIWTSAMLFFQSTLLAGYAYAHFLSTRLTLRKQIAVHMVAWGAGLLFLPITIPAAWSVDPLTSPALQVIGIFALGVGVPFFAVSANAPLLQKWYARIGGQSSDDPYHLYAASNAGSLLALLMFPLVAEPMIGAQAISRLWAGGYLILGTGLALCAFCVARAGPRAAGAAAPRPVSWNASPRQLVLWVALAFVPSSMMLSVTSTISADVGAFPLVWVIPLALYLLSFVIAFSRRLRPPGAVIQVLFLVSLTAVAMPLALNVVGSLGWIIFAALLLAFFSTAVLFHLRLYDERPPETGLTPFYFAMATGGALGGVFNSLVAPLIFNGNIETLMIFGIAGLGLAGRWRPLPDAAFAGAAAAAAALLFSLQPSLESGLFVALVFALVSTAMLAARNHPLRLSLVTSGVLLAGFLQFWDAGLVYRDRSYFGIYTVRDDPKTGLRALAHGTTQHGSQFLDDLGKRPRSLGYYHPNTGLGQIFRSGAVGSRASVGVVGLGVGALACYREPGQTWRFYEIDPVVDEIARDPVLFTYMRDCAGDAPTIFGDARVTLALDTSLLFNLLVIDAYSSDAIPVHLITLEALELYRAHLAPRGLLALHISNRFYRLAPLLSDAANRLDMTVLEQVSGMAERAPGENPTHVVLMSPSSDALKPFVADPRWTALHPSGGTVWTDDRSSLLTALR